MSIADALNEAKIKISAVYTKCSEKGATLPEIQNLENLPATIDTVKSGGGDVVSAYVSGVTLAKPTLNADGTTIETSNVSDIDVLLTKVGYQATGSDTLSPNYRFDIITEDGYVFGSASTSYCINVPSNHSRRDVVNGVVDESTRVLGVNKNTTSRKGQAHTFFFKGGQVVAEIQKYGDMPMGGGFNYRYGEIGTALYYKGYSYGVSCLISHSSSYGNFQAFIDDGLVTTTSTEAYIDIFKEDFDSVPSLNVSYGGLFNSYNILPYLTNFSSGYDFYACSDGSDYYFYYPQDSNYKNWELIKFTIDNTNVTITSTVILNNTIENYTTPQRGCKTTYEHKEKILLQDGFRKYVIGGDRYVKFDIKTDGTNSSVEIKSYPQSIYDVIGDRTIHKMQTFYDNTFSFDLSDGTTLFCVFSSLTGEPEIVEIVEPFIIEDDTNIYHRTFTANRLYWYQKAEAEVTSDNYSSKVAPVSSNPYGPYNATKATVDWLAVPREEGRWNSTVLTGVIRQGAQVERPVFDETNRRVIEVETTIKDELSSVDVEFDWTIEDYNKVV